MGACTKTLTEIRVERIDVPPSLLVCLPAPERPALKTQRDVSFWAAALWEAGQDCRDKLAAVRSIVRPAE